MDVLTIRKIIEKQGYHMPTLRQARAVVALGANGGKSQASALREAGYSEKVARNPDRVFKSSTVLAALRIVGKDEDWIALQHVRALNATYPSHMVFPPFRSPEERKDGQDGNAGDQHGEQMTDANIREFLKGADCLVHKIVHGDMRRQVYFYAPDNAAQIRVLNMLNKIYGAYAPTQIAGKHAVEVFSLAELHRKARERKASMVAEANRKE